MGSDGKSWKLRSRDGLFVKLQTFNIDVEYYPRLRSASRRVYVKMMSRLRRRSTIRSVYKAGLYPPCCGKAKGRQAAHALQFYGERASAL